MQSSDHREPRDLLADRAPDDLRRELDAVVLERDRLRSELEQVRTSPVGPLIDPSRTVRLVAQRYLRRAARLLRGGRRRRPRVDATGAGRLPPPLSGSELAWLARRRLVHRARPWSAPVPPRAPSREWLTPLLLDYFGRDGSTVAMALLATSPDIVVDEKYPYERRYFTYLWRWSRLLSRTDWPGALWGKDDVVSIAQERELALVGPPPWLPRDLLEPASGDPPIAERCFELTWAELSSRAIRRAGSATGDARGPRYYAEKHGNTWLLDARGLPPTMLVVLLRDPRDSYASIRAFEDKDPATSFGIQDRWAGADRVAGILDRNRHRLRWIAGLLDEGRVPVIRYEELTADLPGVARRLEDHLQVELRPAALPADELASSHGTSIADGSGRWQRDLDPEVAERFTRELGPELRALGYPT